MKEILLYGHGGSGNHGCEAIVRTTINMIKRFIPGAEITLSTHSIEEDIKYNIEFDNIIESKQIKRFSLYHFYCKINEKLYFRKKSLIRNIYRETFAHLHKDMLCISIGGDNYCYGIPLWLCLLNQQIHKCGAKNILWGCSIDSIDSEQSRRDLELYDMIVARESITFNLLKNTGISENKLFLYPDPAFTLSSKIERFSDAKKYINAIGINLSPLICSYESKENSILENYIYLIKYILKHTENTVLLIPHVVWSYSDDYQVLQRLQEGFLSESRIQLVGNQYSAEEYKYIISQCKMFIGARTHATIAAYSTCVPTLVVGYSVKSKGIAKDIFGTDENYVIPVQSLRHEDDLTKAFQWLMGHEDEIRTHLKTFMPSYISKAWEAGEKIKELFDTGEK